jgi:hypothetical protein
MPYEIIFFKIRKQISKPAAKAYVTKITSLNLEVNYFNLIA